MTDLNYLLDLQMETADHDYYDSAYEPTHFAIDRSDSMDEDMVRVPTEPRLTIIKDHKLRVDSWVGTYDKFLNTLFN